jgi:hypothetical protein
VVSAVRARVRYNRGREHSVRAVRLERGGR